MGKLNMKEKRNYEIIKKWTEGKINIHRVKMLLNYSERHLYRLKKIYKKKGKEGFVHGNRGRKPKITINQSLTNYILHYYMTEYQDFNFNHYKKMLQREKSITVSYTKIYNVLTKENGILSPRAKKATRKKYKKMELRKKKENKNKTEEDINKMVIHEIALEDATPRKPRAHSFGENIELDASSYIYFGDKKTHLHLSIDEATNICTGAYLDWQETLNGYYNTVYQMFTKLGLPMHFTTDGRTIFDYNSKKMKTDEKAYFTQFKHACDLVGVDLTVTSKPQKKPRVEKYNGTFQDRLSHELKHKNITTIEEANDYLINIFIPNFNKEFVEENKKNKESIAVAMKDSVFEKLTKEEKEALNYQLAVIAKRKFNNGNVISYKNKIYLPYNKKNELICFRKGTECTVIEAFDKNLYVQVYGELLILKELQERLDAEETINEYFDKTNNSKKVDLPKPRADWDTENVNETFEKINKEYKIYDSYNPKV